MNIYKQLNELTEYIEENIEENIKPEILTMFLHTNIYTAGKLFAIFIGQTFSEYVRKRKLSLAGYDLCNSDIKVIDVALKYGYDNATSFSRAFEKFHGVKPSLVNKESKLKNFPRVVFDEEIKITQELDYEIIELPELVLYGVGFATDNARIGKDAPKFFEKISQEYAEKYGRVEYGMIAYDPGHEESQKYYCLWKQKIPEFEEIRIPAGRWLKFRIESDKASKIQEMSRRFYREFLPSSLYSLRPVPELEHYHDNECDFLVAVE